MERLLMHTRRLDARRPGIASRELLKHPLQLEVTLGVADHQVIVGVVAALSTKYVGDFPTLGGFPPSLPFRGYMPSGTAQSLAPTAGASVSAFT